MAALPHFLTGFVGAPALNALVDAINALLGVGPMASGNTNITPSAANTLTTLAVSFPAGRFTSPPTVVASISAAGPSTTTTCFVWASSVTATGFTLNINRSNTTTTGVAWIAALTS